MNRDRIITGLFYRNGTPQNESDIKKLKNSYTDVIIADIKEDELLDICEKWDLKVIATSHLEAHTSVKTNIFRNLSHPVFWGQHINNTSKDGHFKEVSELMQKHHELYPEQICLATIPQTYTEVLQTKTAQNFEERLYNFTNEVECDYICAEFFPFDTKFNHYLSDLDSAADICRKDFRDLWILIQNNTLETNKNLPETQIRLQCNLALAYGAVMLVHSIYTQDNSKDTFRNNFPENNENNYKIINTINSEIKKLSPIIQEFSSVCVVPKGNIEAAHPMIKETLVKLTEKNDFFEGSEDITAIKTQSALLVGFFEKYNGDGSAVMIVNTSDPFNKDNTATVEVDVPTGKLISVFIDGTETVHLSTKQTINVILQTGSAAFITIRKNRRG